MKLIVQIFYRNSTKRNILQEPDEDYGAVHTESEIIDMPYNEYETKKDGFLEKLKLSSKQLQLLERNTVDQSKSDEWRRERKIRLTASNFGKVAKLRDTTSRANAVKYILYELFRGNSATRYINYYIFNS